MDRLKDFHDRHIVLRPDAESFTADGEASRWSNKDLDPVPTSRRTWEWWHVGGFWIAEGFNVAQMETPSSAVSLGLSPGLALVACLIGNLLVTPPLCITSYIGAKYGINFPVIARASFGLFGSYVAMTIRGVFCIILYGVIASLGGNAVRCMLEAIWPSFATWHLHSLPASASITAPDLLSFALFWLGSLPFLFVPISSLRWVFVVKIVVAPFFYVALFTWALTASHGVGPLFSIPNKPIDGYTVASLFCSTLMATIGANATFAVNMPDITRYSKSPRGAAISQAVLLPVVITLVEILGAILAASSQVVYGQVIWNPLSIILLWDNRAAKFFAGFIFAFAMMATNVVGNSVPFANDISGIFPKYFNFRRGQVLCAIIGFASNPWVIQAKASRFLNFVGGYSIFLGPLAGILISDYFLVRKSAPYNLKELYRSHGIYWYFHGWNFRAIAALICGFLPTLPGLIHNVNPHIKISAGEIDFYYWGWLVGLFIAGLVHYVLSIHVFPLPHSSSSVAADDSAAESVEEVNFRIIEGVKAAEGRREEEERAARPVESGLAEKDMERLEEKGHRAAGV